MTLPDTTSAKLCQKTNPPLLGELAYFRTGGTCQEFYQPSSTKDLAAVVASCYKRETPFFVLGGGSNSLVSDEPWPGAVVVFNKMTHVSQVDSSQIECGAGVENSSFAEYCLQNKLAGASWMYGLPGQLGGTVRMNARCYGGEVSQIVESVESVAPNGTVIRWSRDENREQMFRGYKDTVFMTNQHMISQIRFRLQTGTADQISSKMHLCRNDREQKDQYTYPSCGCVFKNNYDPEVSISSGFLLELARAKEIVKPKVRVHPKHANFIQNYNHASSSEILKLSFEMRELVWEEFGVWLEYEMEVLGVLPPDLQAQFKEQRLPRFNKKRLAEARTKFQAKLASSSHSQR